MHLFYTPFSTVLLPYVLFRNCFYFLLIVLLSSYFLSTRLLLIVSFFLHIPSFFYNFLSFFFLFFPLTFLFILPSLFLVFLPVLPYHSFSSFAFLPFFNSSIFLLRTSILYPPYFLLYKLKNIDEILQPYIRFFLNSNSHKVRPVYPAV